MIELPYFHDLPVAVLGLGKTGISAARALMASGAEVLAWDDDPAAREAAQGRGIPLTDLSALDWSLPTTLVLSPGIPHLHPAPHPVVELAKAKGVEIVCDIELLGRADPDAQYIGITGTNGKSTTTAIIGHVLSLSAHAVEVGGNLGNPVLEFERMGPGGYYVLELSSYQLELTASITFEVAVLLNISPDHLERHGGMEGYVAAKKNIFRRQSLQRTAVVGIDDPTSRSIYQDLRLANDRIVVPISAERPVAGGVYVVEGVLIDDTERQEVPALDLREVGTLPGRHNWQNAAAAYAACRAVKVAPPVIAACLRSFPGLKHRQELVATIDGIAYVNDSKATNAEATARALACYQRIYWIAGGRAKEGGLEGLEPYYPRVAEAFLIGEAEEDFARTLAGKVPVRRCGDLVTAVAKASLAARRGGPGGVVLLSPASASFDQFKNFEQRGELFRKAVKALEQEGNAA